jgi:hypothetical protein
VSSRKYPKQTQRINPAKPTGKQRNAPIDTGIRVPTSFQRFAWDIGGVACLAFAAMTLLGLLNLTGGVLLTWWAGVLRHWFGWGGF